MYNPKAEIEVHTNARVNSIRAILLQHRTDEILKPVIYFSQQTTDDEKKHHAFDLETLAIV